MTECRVLFYTCLLLLWLLPLGGSERSRHREWYGTISERPGDARFERIYVQEGTLYHESGREVALWGVNFQSAMSWEWRISNRGKQRRRSYDALSWKAQVDRSLDEIQRMNCQVIRIHLCPGDLADGKGDLLENEWLDMLDYTMAVCYRRGIYMNFAFLNHLGEGDEGAILSSKLKEHKWEAMVVPDKIRATENYILQLVNRPNPYDNNRPYKHNPAWIIAEIMNEPDWPKECPDSEEFSAGIEVYEAWLSRHGRRDSPQAWSAFETESTLNYINRMDALLHDARVPAVPCWNLYWSKGPQHEGWEPYNASAESSVPVLSFSTYPGQDDSAKGIDLSARNYLPYLQQCYDRTDWQGWLREDRFKGRKAAIVYEFETWHNQSAYLYPAMAKYFRAQGAQIATMWTYYLNEPGQARGRSASHNLNLVTTPRKAAGFMVAAEVFKSTPRYISYSTTESDADRFGLTALSFPLDLSAYSSDDILIHSGDIAADFIELPSIPKRIAGYGSSPFVRYAGQGMYFLDAIFEGGRFAFCWDLTVMPHSVFDDTGEVRMDTTRSFPMTLASLGTDSRNWTVYQMQGEQRRRIPVRTPQLTFDVVPGHYQIVHKDFDQHP